MSQGLSNPPLPADGVAKIRLDPQALPTSVIEFLNTRHLATLSTIRADLSPHVVPVGFTFDPVNALVRIITREGSVKVRNAERIRPDGTRPRGAVSQVEHGRWLTLEGPIRVSRDPDEIAEAVSRYAQRYRQPQPNPLRVALIIEVDRVLGRG